MRRPSSTYESFLILTHLMNLFYLFTPNILKSTLLGVSLRETVCYYLLLMTLKSLLCPKTPPVHSGSGQTQRAVGVQSTQAAPRAQVNLLTALRAQGPFFQTTEPSEN